ncbi:hypothetical protein GCM10027185_40010 [Spirosoma pulveris]
MSISITPASATYTVGQSVTLTITGGTTGTAYSLLLYEGDPNTTNALGVDPIINSEGSVTNNTITWQAGQTTAWFAVRLRAGSEGSGRLFDISNQTATEYADTPPIQILPKPALSVTFSPSTPTYTVGQSLTLNVTGGIVGEVYSPLLFDDASYTNDLTASLLSQGTSQQNGNALRWMPGMSSGQIYVTFAGGAVGSGRILEVTNTDFSHYKDSQGLTIVCPTVSISPSSQTIASGGSVTLTASGGATYTWSNGSTANPLVVNNITSATTFSVTGVTGGCSATASAAVSVTQAAPTVDLTPSLTLPQANFAATGAEAIRNFTISLVETGGQPTATGATVITITIPLGYAIAFNSAATSIAVTGGTTTTVNNANWNLTTSSDLQLTLTMKPGQSIGASGQSTLGFTITRSGASKGSANITVNVNDDAGQTYDVNTANNIFARVINAL